MKRTLFGLLIFLVYLALVIVAGVYVLTFVGTKLILFCLILGLLGAIAVGLALWFMHKAEKTNEPQTPDAVNLQALLRDADNKIRQSGRKDAKSLASLPLVYLIGDENSAKTETVRQSGLDPELLAGLVQRDGRIAPTQLANLWLAGSCVLVEAGGALLRQAPLWLRLVKGTQPGKLGSAFSKDSLRPTRSVVVCVSIERLMPPNTSEQIQALAQMLNERLRQLSQTLGISLPVYVLFTKLDVIAPFAEYATKLSDEEVKLPIGSLLSPIGVGTGLYAEQATAQVSSRFDELLYALSEFRLEILSRGGELQDLSRAYEFPRDLRKLRERMVALLVEVVRPSQLGVNPFLRGFFFAGMRPYIIDEFLDLGAAQQPAANPVADSATTVFSLANLRAPQAQAPQPRRGSKRKVPQWVFLPHLFSNIFLADKSALEASRASTKVNVLKRFLLASVSVVVLIFFVLFTISFFKNKALADRVAEARAAQVTPVTDGQFASESDLKTLAGIGGLLEELEDYRKNDAPPMYRWWGLYQGKRLYPLACDAYSDKFRSLLLKPTQDKVLAKLAFVNSPASDYNATYYSLKEYLLTTFNLDENKNWSNFLAPHLSQDWAGSDNVPDNVSTLASAQFQLFAKFLVVSPGCLARPEDAPSAVPDPVSHARAFLNSSKDYHHIYQRMLDAANSKEPAFTFNTKFQGSSQYIVDNHKIENAFTKEGFDLMMAAIQNPMNFQGEPWVLGQTNGGTIDATSVSSQIKANYFQAYIDTWKAYMKEESFVGYKNLQDAGTKLDILDDRNISPLLKFFSLVSRNTNVPEQQISSLFRTPQGVVPAGNPPGVFKSDAAANYMQSLQTLARTIETITGNPTTKNSPEAADQITPVATEAEGKAQDLQASAGAPGDPEVYKTTLDILKQPIKSAKDLAAQAPANAANGGAKDFCSAYGPILAKFPFSPYSPTDATVEEAKMLFQPSTGKIATLYNDSLSKLIEKSGGEYRQKTGSTIPVSHAYLRFLNTTEKISNALFPSGATQPSLKFTLTGVKVAPYPDSVLSIDHKTVKTGETVHFDWVSSPTSEVKISAGENTRPAIVGPWSIFKLAFDSRRPQTRPIHFEFQGNGRLDAVSQFDASEPGAELLNPEFMKGASCVPTVTGH